MFCSENVIKYFNIFRLTDLGSMTPSINVTTLKKKTSSVPSGDNIYPIPQPYYKKVQLPDVVDSEDRDKSDSSSNSIPQLSAGDHLLIPTPSPENLKCNTPDMDRKNVLETIKKTVKIKGKDLISLVYTPHEDSFDENDKQKCESKQDEAQQEMIHILGKYLAY